MNAVPCRSCGSDDLDVLLSLGEQPLANALRSGDELDDPEARFPLDLAFCAGCSLVQITESIPPDVLFASDYAYFTSYSPTVVANAERVVDRLIAERALGPDDLAVEVASNDGYLLQFYARSGVPVLGVDPASNVAAAAAERGVPTVCEFFGRDVATRLRREGRTASVIHANNVMAHVPDPNGVVAGMQILLAEDGIVSIETPYVRDMVDKLEFDTIYHEHLFYYSLTSLSALLERNGLIVSHVERIPLHGGSLRVFAGHPTSVSPSSHVTELLAEERELGVDRRAYYQGFAERVEVLCSDLRDMLAGLRREGRRIGGYGAAAKATVLLNSLGIGVETIDFIADRSPHKQGRYVPGTGIPIVAPEALRERRPDDVVLFAWNFADEIVDQQAAYCNEGGRFIIPIPQPTFR